VLAGDAQGVSNIQAPPGVRLEEAWLQRSFLDGRLSALIGRYDLNSEFYRLASAGLFLNSSFGIGPEFSGSGHGGPSIFPATSLGGRMEYKPTSNVVMRAAVLDGVPVDRDGGGTAAFRGGDGLLVVYEVAWLNRPAPSGHRKDRRFLIGRASGLDPYQDKIAVGGWHYTAGFDDLSARDAGGQPVRRHGSSGAYLVADKLLYRSAAADARKVAGFVQLGTADARVNRFGAYLGMGVVATGFVPGRPTDEFGLAVAMARNGNHYLLGQQDTGQAARRAETTVELTYLSQLGPHVSLQPNVQYVIHPNTVAAVSNALTLQLRAEIAF
jgi:porin